jgi:hypothetical protein
MGRVYLGRSMVSGRPVAVKIIQPAFADDPGFMARFLREVEAVGVVSGAFTAPPIAAGLDDIPPWVATEFIPGPSLRRLIAVVGPLPEVAVWNLAGSLVEALREIHRHGLVHRDLKPENILIATDGPRVIDFGISRDVKRTAVTDSRALIGTLLYMSPEQLGSSRVGQASDVFSLGSVLAFAATRNEPFAAESEAAIVYRIAHDDPDLSGLPPGLRNLVAACLVKDPVLRPSLDQLSSAVKAGRTAFPESSSGKYWPDLMAGPVESKTAQPGAAEPGAAEPAAAETVRLGPEPAAARQAPADPVARPQTSPAGAATLPAAPATHPAPDPGAQPSPRRSRATDGQRRRAARRGWQVAALGAGVLVIAAVAATLALQHKPTATPPIIATSPPIIASSPPPTSTSITNVSATNVTVCIWPSNSQACAEAVSMAPMPGDMIASVGVTLHGLTWSGWGTAQATGHGTMQSGLSTAPATVILEDMQPYTSDGSSY